MIVMMRMRDSAALFRFMTQACFRDSFLRLNHRAEMSRSAGGRSQTPKERHLAFATSRKGVMEDWCGRKREGYLKIPASVVAMFSPCRYLALIYLDLEAIQSRPKEVSLSVTSRTPLSLLLGCQQLRRGGSDHLPGQQLTRWLLCSTRVVTVDENSKTTLNIEMLSVAPAASN